MPSRAYLSEEAEAEEAQDRDRLRQIRGKIRELIDRHRRQLAEVRGLADEYDRLQEARRPGEAELDRIHAEYKALGGGLAKARDGREAARARLDEALAALREFESTTPRGESARPSEIRRQIAELEHRQQTHALPLAEENALLGRIRELVQRAAQAEKDSARNLERQAKVGELSARLAERRAQLQAASDELPRLRAERDRRMQAIRDRLAEAGQRMGKLREVGNARRAAIDRLQAIGREIESAEREADALLRQSKGRRDEARRVLGEYRREARGAASETATEASVADRQLDELLKRGRVTLRG